MKKILVLFSAFFVFSITSCDDSNRPDCTFNEFSDILETSSCISDDFISVCRKISPQVVCSSRDPNIRVIERNNCTFIDCQTLSCDTFLVDGPPFESGLMTEMEFDPGTGFPMGVFEVDEIVAEFECVLTQP